MGNFSKFDKGRREGKGFGGDRFGGGRKFGGHSDIPRQMFSATCSQCGQSCEVPFRPTGDRPVFCSNCFKSQGGPSPRFAPKSFGGSNRGGSIGSSGHGGNASVSTGGSVSKAQFDSLNAKLDKILSMLGANKAVEAPTPTQGRGSDRSVGEKVVKKEKAPAKKAKGKKK